MIEELLKVTSTEAWKAYRYLRLRASVDPAFAKRIEWRSHEQDLVFKFTWTPTPQGYAFWERVSDQTTITFRKLLTKAINKPWMNRLVYTIPKSTDWRTITRQGETYLAKAGKDFITIKSTGIITNYQSPLTKCDFDRLDYLAHTFYLLQELKTLKPTRTIRCRRAFPAWHGHLTSYTKDFTERLARTFRDTMALMCFGEARHYHKRQDTPDPKTKALLSGLFGTRTNIYLTVGPQLAWREIERLTGAFLEDGWERGYAGPPWANIVRKCLSYERRSPTLFCDAVFGLVHNNGIAFNKKHIISLPSAQHDSFKKFLDLRQESSILQTDLKTELPYCVETEAYYLLVDAVKMGLVKRAYFEPEGVLDGFRPVGTFKLAQVDWEGAKLEDIAIEENEDD